MQLAAYAPVAHLLATRRAHVLIISTMSSKYSSRFVRNLGFELPGALLSDTKRRTHSAAGLRSSVFGSLVMPFRKHLATFGAAALGEALRVSLKNATAGHGSSWQQGATIVLEHAALAAAAAGDEAAAGVTCTWAHRECFPGDWRPVSEVLADGLGIATAPAVSFPERLQFVVDARNGRAADDGAGKRKAAAACEDDACSVDALRRRLDAGADEGP